MFMEERQKEILDTVNKMGRISVLEIQDKYGISGDSARRDLRILESRGLLKRTHGGAIKMMHRGTLPEDLYNPGDLTVTKEDYLAIAKKAITHIGEKDVIYLTTSLTGYYMACSLPEDFPFTVVTNSVTNANELRKHQNISVILMGGEMSHRGHCHDCYTIQMMKTISLDKAFLTTTALSMEFGASYHSSTGAEFLRTVMKQSAMNIGLYPSETVGRNSIYSICGVQEFDRIITDSGISEDFVTQSQEMDIAIDVVPL